MRQAIQQIDLRSTAFMHAPEKTWTRLINQGPIITTRLPLLGRIALTTHYEQSQQVLRDTQRFSVDARQCGHRTASGMRWWVPSLFKPLANNLLTVDGEEHRALRRRVDFAFRRSELGTLQTSIEHFTTIAISNLMDDISRYGSANFIECVARPVPQAVISCLLGLDAKYSQRHMPFNKALSALGSIQRGTDLFRTLPAIRLIKRTLEHEIAERRRSPNGDLLSRLVSSEGEGRALSNDEMLAMAFLLFVAGHETTTHLMSTSLFSILTTPDIREQITEPLPDRSIHEFVRFNSPVQMSKPRFVLEDTDFAGASLRKGDTVAVLIGSANRDHSVFDNPSVCRLENASAKHLGFGTGPHTCFGLHLALRETSTVINQLMFNSPVALSNHAEAFRWGQRLGLRSLTHLMVRQA